MASLASLPFPARAAATAVVAVAGLLAAAPSCLASAALTVADAAPQPQPGDASYRHLVQAAKAVVGVKVHALPDARSNADRKSVV